MTYTTLADHMGHALNIGHAVNCGVLFCDQIANHAAFSALDGMNRNSIAQRVRIAEMIQHV